MKSVDSEIEERSNPRVEERKKIPDHMIQSQRLPKNSKTNNFDDSSKNKNKGTFLKTEK